MKNIETMTTADLIAAKQFTEVGLFRVFNVDMVAAGTMKPEDVRGVNRFLVRFPKHNDVAKADPKSVSVKFDKKGNITKGTDARLAMIQEHAARVQADAKLCPMLHR